MNERYPADKKPPSPPTSQLGSQSVAQSTLHERPKPAMAVALHYSGKGAPRVTAKGNGLIAQNIIATAHKHGVPLEQDAALVGALSQIDLGREIPRELWIAVAHVLTFAWSVAGKKP